MAAAAGAAVEQPQPREWQKDAAREIWEVGGFTSCLQVWLSMICLPMALCV